MRRYQFESLIFGEWKEIYKGRARENGKFKTYVRKPWKFVTDGKTAIRGRNWLELAKVLELVPQKEKTEDNAVSKKVPEKRWIKKRVKSKVFSGGSK